MGKTTLHSAKDTSVDGGGCASSSRLRKFKLVSPVVVIDLVVVEPVDIVVQHIPVARRQPLVVSRLFEGINDVVQKTVVETALIEVGLHFGEFLLGPVKTRVFFFTRVSSTPDMVKILPDMGEHMGPPLVAMVAVVAEKSLRDENAEVPSIQEILVRSR